MKQILTIGFYLILFYLAFHDVLRLLVSDKPSYIVGGRLKPTPKQIILLILEVASLCFLTYSEGIFLVIYALLCIAGILKKMSLRIERKYPHE